MLPIWATGLFQGDRPRRHPAPLDLIRPDTWADEWNDELLDVIRVLTATVDLGPQQAAAITRVLDGALIDADQLPQPTPAERRGAK